MSSGRYLRGYQDVDHHLAICTDGFAKTQEGRFEAECHYCMTVFLYMPDRAWT
jgi:hypothetical protein